MGLTFEDLEREGEAALLRAEAEQLPESLNLDFKADVGQRPLFDESGRLTREGRTTIAKAASAFANSAGGVIVIGVDCRPVDGVDVIASLSPMPDLARRFASVSGALGELLQPRSSGLKAISVPSAIEDTGYISIEVERSERRPHRSQVDHHYYKRSGSSSFVMEHYDVEDAFKRQTSPILAMRMNWRTETVVPQAFVRVVAELLLENAGVTTAKHLSCSFVKTDGLLELRFGSGNPHAANSLASQVLHRKVLSKLDNFVVNPGELKHFEDIRFKIQRRSSGEIFIDDIPLSAAACKVDYVLSAENMQPATGTISIATEHFSTFVALLESS